METKKIETFDDWKDIFQMWQKRYHLRQRPILKVAGLDFFDGTPIIDIKGYRPSSCGMHVGHIDSSVSEISARRPLESGLEILRCTELNEG